MQITLQFKQEEVNNLVSLVADTAFSIASGIVIDRASLNYDLCMISNKEVRDHVVDVINSLFNTKYESKPTDYRVQTIQ